MSSNSLRRFWWSFWGTGVKHSQNTRRIAEFCIFGLIVSKAPQGPERKRRNEDPHQRYEAEGVWFQQRWFSKWNRARSIAPKVHTRSSSTLKCPATRKSLSAEFQSWKSQLSLQETPAGVHSNQTRCNFHQCQMSYFLDQLNRNISFLHALCLRPDAFVMWWCGWSGSKLAIETCTKPLVFQWPSGMMKKRIRCISICTWKARQELPAFFEIGRVACVQPGFHGVSTNLRTGSEHSCIVMKSSQKVLQDLPAHWTNHLA